MRILRTVHFKAIKEEKDAEAKRRMKKLMQRFRHGRISGIKSWRMNRIKKIILF
ncbi:hypothetical protein ACTHO5_23410 [Cytobacillus praedii]